MAKPKKATKRQLADEWYAAAKENGTIIWDKHSRDMFRETTAWNRFADGMRKRAHGSCDFCTLKARALTVHHLYPDDYDNLNPKNFKVVDWACHKKFGLLSRKKDRSQIPEYWLPFLENSGP